MKSLRLFSLLTAFALSITAITAAAADTPQLRGTVIAVSPKASEAWLIDLATQQTLKVLPTGKGPHEVAVSPDGRRAAISDYHGGAGAGPSQSLTIIDIAGAEVVKTIQLDPHQKPHGSRGSTTTRSSARANHRRHSSWSMSKQGRSRAR